MNLLHASYIKIVQTGGNLAVAPEIDLEKAPIIFDATPEIVEHIISKHPKPKKRYRVGTGFKLKGVLGSEDMSILVKLLGGSYTNDVYALEQDVATLVDYDMELGIFRPSDGAVVPLTLTEMNFIASVGMAMEQKKVTYLPFEADSGDESDLTIDNS